MGRNIGQHHIVDNKAKVESHRGLNKISSQHLDKPDKERLFRKFADNIVVAVVADIAVDIVVVVEAVDIAVVDKLELRLLADKPHLPSLPALGDKNNLARLFVVLASA